MKDSPPHRALSNWFKKNYSKTASKSAHFNPISGSLVYSKSAMNFHSPTRSRARSSSPSYIFPTKSDSSMLREEYVVGCSVCGTNAVEDISYSYNDSPPHVRPSHHCYCPDPKDPNSGAYVRLIEITEKPGDEDTKPKEEVTNVKKIKTGELIDSFDKGHRSPFRYRKEGDISTSPRERKIVYKEVSPPPKMSLTPLNYDEKQVIKESGLTNIAAKYYVDEEERTRVVIRRAEYANRSIGITKTVIRTEKDGQGVDHTEMEQVSEFTSNYESARPSSKQLLLNKMQKRNDFSPNKTPNNERGRTRSRLSIQDELEEIPRDLNIVPAKYDGKSYLPLKMTLEETEEKVKDLVKNEEIQVTSLLLPYKFTSETVYHFQMDPVKYVFQSKKGSSLRHLSSEMSDISEASSIKEGNFHMHNISVEKGSNDIDSLISRALEELPSFEKNQPLRDSRKVSQGSEILSLKTDFNRENIFNKTQESVQSLDELKSFEEQDESSMEQRISIISDPNKSLIEKDSLASFYENEENAKDARKDSFEELEIEAATEEISMIPAPNFKPKQHQNKLKSGKPTTSTRPNPPTSDLGINDEKLQTFGYNQEIVIFDNYSAPIDSKDTNFESKSAELKEFIILSPEISDYHEEKPQTSDDSKLKLGGNLIHVCPSDPSQFSEPDIVMSEVEKLNLTDEISKEFSDHKLNTLPSSHKEKEMIGYDASTSFLKNYTNTNNECSEENKSLNESSDFERAESSFDSIKRALNKDKETILSGDLKPQVEESKAIKKRVISKNRSAKLPKDGLNQELKEREHDSKSSHIDSQTVTEESETSDLYSNQESESRVQPLEEQKPEKTYKSFENPKRRSENFSFRLQDESLDSKISTNQAFKNSQSISSSDEVLVEEFAEPFNPKFSNQRYLEKESRNRTELNQPEQDIITTISNSSVEEWSAGSPIPIKNTGSKDPKYQFKVKPQKPTFNQEKNKIQTEIVEDYEEENKSSPKKYVSNELGANKGNSPSKSSRSNNEDKFYPQSSASPIHYQPYPYPYYNPYQNYMPPPPIYHNLTGYDPSSSPHPYHNPYNQPTHPQHQDQGYINYLKSIILSHEKMSKSSPQTSNRSNTEINNQNLCFFYKLQEDSAIKIQRAFRIKRKPKKSNISVKEVQTDEIPFLRLIVIFT